MSCLPGCIAEQALSRNESDEHIDSKAPEKIMFAHVCMLLRPFGLENFLPSVLAELRHVPDRPPFCAPLVLNNPLLQLPPSVRK